MEGTLLLEQNGLFYHTMQPEDKAAVVDILCESFLTEPLNQHLGVKPEEFRAIVMNVIDMCSSNGLSVSVKTEDGDIVAAMINSDLIALRAVEFVNVPTVSLPIIAMVNAVDEAFIEQYNIGDNDIGVVLEVYLIAVLPTVRGRGIAANFGELSNVIAKKNGFRYVIVEASNPRVQQIYRSKGVEVASCLVSDFEYNGQKPFETMTTTTGIFLFCLDMQQD